jgi:hypothetical protein
VVIVVSVVRTTVRVDGSEKESGGPVGARRVVIALKKAGRHEHGCGTAVSAVHVGPVDITLSSGELQGNGGDWVDEDEKNDLGVAGGRGAGTELKPKL